MVKGSDGLVEILMALSIVSPIDRAHLASRLLRLPPRCTWSAPWHDPHMPTPRDREPERSTAQNESRQPVSPDQAFLPFVFGEGFFFGADVSFLLFRFCFLTFTDSCAATIATIALPTSC